MLPALSDAAADLGQRVRAAGFALQDYAVERALIDAEGNAEQRFRQTTSPPFWTALQALRTQLSPEISLAATEATARYRLINALVGRVERRAPRQVTFADRLDTITNHPVMGSLLFLLVMAAVFQMVFPGQPLDGFDCQRDSCPGRRPAGTAPLALCPACWWMESSLVLEELSSFYPRSLSCSPSLFFWKTRAICRE